MKAVLQTVIKAKCTVDEKITGEIKDGLLIYFGVDKDDEEEALIPFLDKIIKLRIFRDENGKMNKSLLDYGYEILFISQFTLASNPYSGNRPSFDSAARGEDAELFYNKALSYLREKGIKTEEGKFGAHMLIESINDGPKTFFLDSNKIFKKNLVKNS